MARQLDPMMLRELWEQPALEYTDILDGLFHRLVLVVLCEAEADCHFYAAAIDAAHADHVLPITPSDILFVPSFGKTGMAKLAYFLRAVGVKVVATPDLDVLNDKAVIRSLVTALGSPWSSVEHTYDTATAQFRRLGPHRRLNRDVLAALKNLFHDQEAAVYSNQMRAEVGKVTRMDNLWAALKKDGQAAFTEAPNEAELLLNELDRAGVGTARGGELEQFAPLLQVGKGAGWLQQALAEDAHRSPEALAHARRIVSAGSSD